jgi:[ribosomal protein S5]-alanine N-acetyltransferase
MIKIAPVLKTERLLLRPAQFSDAEAVFAWSSSPEATKYLFWLPHRTKKDSERLVATWVRKRCHFSWLLDKNGFAIGEIELIKDLPDEGAMIGYVLNPAFWKMGYMSEALKAVLLRLGEEGYCYAEAETDERNTSSIRLLERNGFSLLESREKRHIAKKNADVIILRFRKLLIKK